MRLAPGFYMLFGWAKRGKCRGGWDLTERVQIDHAALWVRDTEKALKFYREIFGLTVREQRLLGSGIRATALEAGESLLFLLQAPDQFFSEMPEYAGVDHICLRFEAEEFRRIQERVEKLGIPVVEELRERGGATGLGLSFYVEDPDHHRLEVKRS